MTWAEFLPLVFMAVMGLALLVAYVGVLRHLASKTGTGQALPAPAAPLPPAARPASV